MVTDETECSCGRPAVFFRKYEGTHLCSPHFIRSVESRVMKAVGRHGMVKPGDHVIFALSGGKDSATVCSIVVSGAGSWRGINFTGVSVDEGVGPYRKQSIAAAAELCKRLNIQHRIFSFREELGATMEQKLKAMRKSDPQSPHLSNPCTICSIGRRHILNRVSRELGGTKVCFGHNLDDEAQSVVMNFVRGDLQRASRGGAVTSTPASRSSRFIPRIKPLRDVPEREVALYAWLKRLPFRCGACPYAGGLRLEARHFLNRLEMLSPGVKFSVLHTYDKVLPFMRAAASGHAAESCRTCGEPTPNGRCRACELWDQPTRRLKNKKRGSL